MRIESPLASRAVRSRRARGLFGRDFRGGDILGRLPTAVPLFLVDRDIAAFVFPGFFGFGIGSGRGMGTLGGGEVTGRADFDPVRREVDLEVGVVKHALPSSANGVPAFEGRRSWHD